MYRLISSIKTGVRAWPVVLLFTARTVLSTEPSGSTNTYAGGTSGLSVAGAQRLALERNWDLLAAAAGVNAASAQKIVSREFPNPTFSGSSTKINVDGHASGTPEGDGVWERNYDTIFAINQLLEIGGKRRSRQASAQANFENARALFYDAKRTLDLAVTKAYVAVAQAEENVRVLHQSAASLRKESQLAELRLKAGDISEADRRQIEITAERFELDAATSESTATQARVALQILLGQPRPNGEVILSDTLETLCAEIPSPNYNDSGVGRPDVAGAEAALRKAEADLRLQKANRIPDPTVLGQYEHEPPDNPNSIGFGVSFPLPLWNRNRGNILAAESVREQAAFALQKIQAQAAADIATARFAYSNASLRFNSYRDTLRPKSQQIRTSMAYAYEKGGASLLELLVAERNDNDVRLALAQAASDLALAVATLKAATLTIQSSQITK